MPIDWLWSSDPNKTLSETLFDGAALAFGGVEMLDYPGNVGTEGDPTDSFDPRAAHRLPDLDTGGRQPALGFMQGTKDPTIEGMEQAAKQARPWFTYTLSPLSAAIHGLKVPLLGTFSLILEKTKQGGFFVYSLLYMALPTLSWFLGVDPVAFRSIEYELWRESPAGATHCVRCDACGLWKPDDLFFDEGDLNKRFWLGCLCQQALITHKAFGPIRQSLTVEDFDNRCTYSSAQQLAQMLKIQVTCPHEDAGESVTAVPYVPRPTLDGLYMHIPEHVWRGNMRYGGLRCPHCYQDNVHKWHPALYDCITAPKRAAPLPVQQQLIRLINRWNILLSEYREGEVVYVCGLDPSRVRFHEYLEGHVVILHMDEDVPYMVRSHLKGWDLNKYRFLRVPSFGWSSRPIAHYRVLLAYSANAPVRIMVVNQSTNARDRPYIDHLPTSPYNSASGAAGNTLPAYAGALFVRGRHGIDTVGMLFASFFYGAMIYGWDEIYPAGRQQNVCCVYKSLASPAIMMGQTTPQVRKPEVAVHITGEAEHSKKVRIIKWSRQNVYWVNRVAGSDVDPSRLTFWHIWADPRPIFKLGAEPKDEEELQKWLTIVEHGQPYVQPRRIVAPGENVFQELVASLGGVSIFTIGTRGDIVPFKALARYLAQHRVPVRFYILNTIDEGKRLLDSALGKLADSDAVRIFNRARTQMLEAATGASLIHGALMVGDFPTIDLTPPPDLVQPRTVAGGWLMALGSALLGVWYEPSARCGPYTGPRVVPTSHNGVDFLKARQNRGKIPYGAAWGSDGEPAKGFEDVPLIPDGDHLEIFRDYANIVCHGGVGTVSTAAAAGARVIVPEGGLDRSRRNPYDAGLGLVPGADPDNLLLVLADQDIRFFALWLRKNLWKPWKLWTFYGFPGIGWAAFRAFIFYVIYSRAFKRTTVSSEPLLVLFGVLGGKVRSWWQFALVLFGCKAVDAVLNHLNISYMRVLSSFITYNARLITSPLALYIAESYNIGLALLYAGVSPWTYRVVTQYSQALQNWILGVAPLYTLDGEERPQVYMEFSVRLYSFVPVLHVALICPKLNKRYEGRTVGKLYVVRPSEGGITSPIVFPTTLSWSEVEAIPHYTGVYSLAWNCQTSIIVAFNERLVSLGPGGIVPYACTLFAACWYTVLAVGSTACWAVIQLLPATIDPTSRRPETLSIVGDLLTSLWNRMSAAGQWDPVLVVHWWRGLYVGV